MAATERQVQAAESKLGRIRNIGDLKNALTALKAQHKVYDRKTTRAEQLGKEAADLHQRLQRELVATHSRVRKFIGVREQIQDDLQRARERARRAGGEDALKAAEKEAAIKVARAEKRLADSFGKRISLSEIESQIRSNRGLTSQEEQLVKLMQNRAKAALNELKPLVGANERMISSTQTLLREYKAFAGIGSVDVGKMSLSDDIRKAAQQTVKNLQEMLVLLERDKGRLNKATGQLQGVVSARPSKIEDVNSGDLALIFGAASALVVLSAGTAGTAGVVAGALAAAALVSHLVNRVKRWLDDIRKSLRR